MNFSAEYSKVLAFRSFRKEIIQYFSGFISDILLRKKVPYLTKHVHRFVSNIFVDWWFVSGLHQQIDAFVPSDLSVSLSDIRYFLRNYNLAVEDSDLAYDRIFVKFSAQRYALSCTIPPPLVSSRLFTNADGEITCLVSARRTKEEQICERLSLSNRQLAGLRRRCILGKEVDITPYIAVVLLRLDSIGSLNMHMSVPLSLLSFLSIDHELFGTPLNTHLASYCSPYYDIDRYFGSSGSFFDYELLDYRRYMFSPPYDSHIMEAAVERLLAALVGKQEVTVLCLLPVWDPTTQELLRLPNRREPFPAYDKLIVSPYVRESCVLTREACPYFSYFREELVEITATHLVVLSTLPALPSEWQLSAITAVWPRIPESKRATIRR